MTDQGMILPAGAVQQKAVVGLLVGAWKSYVNPAAIAVLEVFQTGNGWRIVAVLNVTDRDGYPIRQPMLGPFDTEAEADAALDDMIDALPFHLVTPVQRPDPTPPAPLGPSSAL